MLGVLFEERVRLFRRAGGKYPIARRERRAISVGAGKPGSWVHESWCQGGSESVVDALVSARSSLGVLPFLRVAFGVTASSPSTS